jgi:5'-methylthioadenosine phosphorylase
MPSKIPDASFAIIGGSSTFSIDFPAALRDPNIDVIKKDLVFDTPYGQSPPFTLFSLGGKRTLTCKMHGWRTGVSRADASRQIFWVFREAGVSKILAEGGVGAVNHLLNPRDVVIPTDYIDNSMRKDVSLGSHYLLIMRKAICKDLHGALLKSAGSHIEAKRHEAYERAIETERQYGDTKQNANIQNAISQNTSSQNANMQDTSAQNTYALRNPRVFERGIYAVTDGRHFESPAEVSVLKQWGSDIVGQSICPEVYLAREIGACYAGIYLVVNYAEGIVEDWQHEELSDIFYAESELIGGILIDALGTVGDDKNCECADLRQPTLLKEEK